MMNQQKESSRIRPASSRPKKDVGYTPARTTKPSPLMNGGYSVSKQNSSTMQHDKGQLYEEALAMKQNIHDIQKENIVLKTQILHLEKEDGKKEKTIKELVEKIRNPPNIEIGGKKFKVKKHLLGALKGKMKEAKQENRTLKQELIRIQKDSRITMFNEIETESKIYAEECIRLENMIDLVESKVQYLSPEDAAMIDEKVRAQDDLLANMKEESARLRGAVKSQEDELKKYQAKLTQDKSPDDNKSLQNQQLMIKEQKKEIQKLKERFEALGKGSEESKNPAKIGKGEMEELKNTTEGLGAKLKDKSEKIKRLEIDIEDAIQAKDSEIIKLKEQLKSSGKKREDTAKSKSPMKKEAWSEKEIETASTELKLSLRLNNIPTEQETLMKVYQIISNLY